MDTYVDSSILVKIYVKEPDSPDAIALLQGLPAPGVILTPLQELEIANAIRLKHANRMEKDYFCFSKPRRPTPRYLRKPEISC